MRLTASAATVSFAGLMVSAVALLGAPKLAEAKPGEVVIGYVNMQRAILEVDEGKRARAQLQSTFTEKQKKLQSREAELKKLKDAIEKESVVKDDDSTRAKKTEFQNKLLELQQIFMKEQKELEESQAKQINALADKMRTVIKEVGEAGGYTLILEGTEARMLFARPHLDLTNEVIRKYNARHK